MLLTVEDAKVRLAALLKKNRLVILAGSGISRDSKIPTWEEFIEEFIGFASRFTKLLTTPTAQARYEALLKDADKLKSHNAPRVASALKKQLKELNSQGYKIEDAFRHWLYDTLNKGEPNGYHHAVVRTNYPFILTTNYDHLFENAAVSEGFIQLSLRSYTFKQADRFAEALWQISQEGKGKGRRQSNVDRSSIIHLHGDTTAVSLDDIVLASEDYTALHYNYPGFKIALKTLFMTYCVLFVGYGGHDPNLESLLEEQWHHFSQKGDVDLPRNFIVLPYNEVDYVQEKYRDRLGMEIISINYYSELYKLLTELSEISSRKPT
jgi:hypothetical protein